MDKEEKVLTEFLLNIDCLNELKPYIKQVNIFDILKTSYHEIRHSNILAWLLNPQENHNLGDLFISNFIREVIKGYKDKYDISDWAFIDYSRVVVERECYQQGKKRNFLDILMLFEKEKKLIAIENKFKAKEGKDQTKIYKEILEKKYPKYEKIYLYLTLDGDEAQDEEWDSISYDLVKTTIENIVKNNDLKESIKLILKDYIEIIGGDSMEEEKKAEICSRIYKEHKEALDLILEYKNINTIRVANFVKEVMREINKENDNIIYDGKFDSGVTYVRFSTEYLDSVLGFSQETKNKWRHNQRYLYEIKTGEARNDKAITIYLTLTTDNLEDKKDEILTKHNVIKKKFEKKVTKRKNEHFDTVNKKEIIPAKDIDVYIAEAESKKELKAKIVDYINKTEDAIKKVLKN